MSSSGEVPLAPCRCIAGLRKHLHSEKLRSSPRPWWFWTQRKFSRGGAAIFVRGSQARRWANSSFARGIVATAQPGHRLLSLLYFLILIFLKLFRFFLSFHFPVRWLWKQLKNYDQPQRKHFHFSWSTVPKFWTDTKASRHKRHL